MTTTVRRRKPRFAAGGSYGGGIPESTLNPAWSSTGSYTPGTPATTNQSFSANPSSYQGINATAQGLPAATPAAGQFSAGPQSSQAGSWGASADQGIQGNAGYTPTAAVAPTYQQANTAGNYGSYKANITAPPAASSFNANAGIMGWAPNTYPVSSPYSEGGPVNMGKGGAVPKFAHGGGTNNRWGPFAPSRVNVGGGRSSSGNTDPYAGISQNDVAGQVNKYEATQKPVQDALQGEQQGAIPETPDGNQGQNGNQGQKGQAGGPTQNRGVRQAQQPRQSPRQAQQSASDNSAMQKLMSGSQGSQGGVGNGATPGSSVATNPATGDPGTGDPSNSGGGDGSSEATNPGTGMTAGGDADAAAGAQGGAAAGGLAKGGPVVNPKEKPYRDKWRAKNGQKATPYRAFDEGGNVSPEYNNAVGSGMGFADGGPVSYALGSNDGGSVLGAAEGGAIPESTTDVNTADDKQGSEAPNPDLASDDDSNDPGNGGDPLLGVKQSLTYARQKAGLNDDIFKQLASNSGPIQPSPSTGGKPPPGTLPPPPFNPRDWVPGGKKSSDKGDTMSAKKGGAIPDSFDAGGAVGEGGDPTLSDPNGSSAMGAALADGGNGIDSTLNPDEVPNTPADPSTKKVQKQLKSESNSDSQEPDND